MKPTYNISIAMLRAYLTECSEAYYQEAVSIIDDAEYDRLNNVLRELEKANGADTPSMDQTIITDHVDGFKKVRHATMMHSQRDIYTEEELNKWMDDVPNNYNGYVVMKKLDGLSCSLIYEDGKLVRAATRGDGWEGDDVTAQVMNLPSVPKVLKGKMKGKSIEVRGEIVMSYREFNRVNDELKAQGKEPLANPRNAASGALKSLDITVARDRGLQFIAWGVVLPEEFNKRTFAENILLLNGDFEIVEGEQIGSYGVSSAIKRVQEGRLHLDIPIDGAVVRLNNLSICKQLGMTGKYPKYSVAFKFPQDSKFSKLVSVDWQVAKSGKVTPVANYEPVQMNGTTCKRATMNSLKWLESNLEGLHIGDSLELIKGGEIIPKILGYKAGEERGIEVRRPHNCPVCGSRLIRKGAHLWCENDECPAKAAATVPVGNATTPVGNATGTVTAPTASDNMKSILNGATVCVTGNFGTPEERKKIEAAISQNGGKVASSITLKTTMIVVPDDVEEWKRKVPGKWQKIQELAKQMLMVKHSDFWQMYTTE